ncbi:restriction endonuclease subunit S [Acinetobacter lwoffii]|nr:restriction endonuclease subunit S [Acinetobacter lwoffii]MCO8072234.1 restriction endonuclease subunit S [Acinetobacter lwoffii]MCO8075287.1 restriction endonuclease subunit S [Acinetobacter lwoffii]
MSAPTLRFKEFESKVEVKKLGNISNIVVGFVGTVSDQYCDPNEGIPFVRTQNVREGYFSIENLEYVTKEFHKKNKKSQIFNGDVLIARVGANMGMVCAVENLNTEANCANVIIIKKNSQLNSQYLSLFLNSENGQKQIHSGGAGGAQAVFNTTLAKEISFPYFPLQEQTKIASFLSAVDEKISQLTQKHQLLSQYKQGMMQKLFSQQIRFKSDDGSEFGEWEILKFKDVITIKYGKDHKKLKDGNIPVLGTGGIMRYVESYLYDGESILIGRKGTIDKPQFISGKFWTVDTLFYTEIGEKIRPKFAFQQLLLVNWLNLNEATGVPSLNTTSIGNIELKVPCLEEQTKIANFLSSIDQKIEVTAQQIEQAKQWKKGLLQQMFV